MRALWLVMLVAACGNKGDKAAPKAEPFKGPLTVAKLMATKDAVTPLLPWDQGLAKLERLVGPPTKIAGEKYLWGAMEGDDCAYLYVTQEDGAKYGAKGKVVGVVSDAQVFNKDGALFNRAECLTLVGKGVAAEDPNAPGPRADGVSYEVSDLAKLAVAARSKWTGKQIRATGIVAQMMDTTALLRDRTDSNIDVDCDMADKATPPMNAVVVLEGTVEMKEFVRGTGEPGMEVKLSSCKVVTLDCKAKVAEMHAYFDLIKATGANGPKPWPTGDDKTDTAIRAAIDKVNEGAKGKAAALAKGIKDGDAPLLAKCAPAAARHKAILKSDEADRVALLQSVGDTFAECDCQVDMPLWLARQYIGLYVASGAALDKPLTFR